MSHPVRILIADDHEFLRKTLSQVLDSQEEFLVVGEAPDGRAAVEMAGSLLPDIVLMDYDMPELNGVEATRQILADHGGMVIIGLTMHERGPVEAAMLEAGAAAFFTKGGSLHDLIAKIQQLADELTAGP
jgi:DNA-binding NarL/FixJ family response regulator